MEKILIVILEACDFKSCEVHKRYLSYISEVLKQYGYNQQDSNKKIKK